MITDSQFTAITDAALAAGARIMADHGRDNLVSRKTDGSPVTETDTAAERIIVNALRAISPFDVIAEEEAHAGTSPVISDDPFWLVDALDGTRDFIHGGLDFTVNIALVENGAPVFGIIHAPAFGVTWHAQKGKGAFRIENGASNPIGVRDQPTDGLLVLAGVRSSEPVVLDPFIGAHKIARRLQRSSSLKFCLVAEGSADIYSRLGHTYEWDTAAGDIILREAGGAVLDLRDQRPIRYGKVERRFENEGFIAASRASFKI